MALRRSLTGWISAGSAGTAIGALVLRLTTSRTRAGRAVTSDGSQVAERDAAGSLDRPHVAALEGVWRAASTVVLSAEQTLERGRVRLFSAVPTPADARWRVSTALLRGTVLAVTPMNAGAFATLINASARRHVAERRPAWGWTPLALSEVLRGITQALDLDAEARPTRSGVMVLVYGCPFTAATDDDPDRDGAILEVIYGAGQSLFSGIAEAAGARYDCEEARADMDVEFLRRLDFTLGA